MMRLTLSRVQKLTTSVALINMPNLLDVEPVKQPGYEEFYQGVIPCDSFRPE